MRYVDMNADQLRAAIIAAEDGYHFAFKDKDFAAAERWSNEMYIAFKHFVALVQKDDPYTTEADIRHFEGFKYA
jgi:hypothetical protein